MVAFQAPKGTYDVLPGSPFLAVRYLRYLATHPTGQRTTNSCDQHLVSPGSLRGVQIDQLNFRVRRESLNPYVNIRRLDRETLALDELDDFAAL